MKAKKFLSLFCTAAMLFSLTAAPVGEASAYTVTVQESSDGEPVMPAEVTARIAEERNHVYHIENWANGDLYEVFDNALIMPGDTFEIEPYTKSGDTETRTYYAGAGYNNGGTEPYWQYNSSSIQYNLPDGFEMTGTVEPVDFVEKTFSNDHETVTVKFCTKWKNNTNCPLVVGINNTGNGSFVGYRHYNFLKPNLTVYAPYYNITYPETDENYGRDGLEQYFWPQGKLEDLDFPKYYWVTDTPYTLTLPNPVQKGQHFNYWADDEATQTNNGQYTDITICYTVGKDSHGNNYSPETFKSYRDAKIAPSFESGKTITFNGNGGTINGYEEYIAEIPEYNEETGEYGYDLENFVPTKDGDTFLGWCEKPHARYDTFVTKDDESAVYEKYWQNDRYNRNANVTLYAKWASNTREDLEKNGWELTEDGTLWLLNNDGVEAWNAAKEADPTLAPKVKGLKQSFNPDPDNRNDCADSLYDVFAGCVNIEDLVIEAERTSLSNSAFKDCTKLKTVTYLERPSSGNLYYAFQDAPKDVVVTLPEGYESDLGDYQYLASSDKRYGVIVNGVMMTESTLTAECGDGTATFDPKTNTLTLENASLTASMTPHWMAKYSDPETYTMYNNAAIISDLENLNIVLKGKNVIAKNYLDAFRAYGDVNISGDGSLEATYTLDNYFIIDNETGEQVPVTATFPMTTTALGNVTVDGVTLPRLNTTPAGDLTIKDATLNGGVLSPKGKLTITGSALKNFVGGTSGTYDKGDDYNPIVGGKNMNIENTTFYYVQITAPEDCETITFKDSTIQLTGKFSAGEGTKLDIINTKFDAYGQSDGVTNISADNITLTDCEIVQGSWTERGYFSIMLSSELHKNDEISYTPQINDDNWYKSSGDDYAVFIYRDPADGNDFTSLLEGIIIDDDTIDDFKAGMNDSASIKIAIGSEALENLSEGKHIIYAIFKDGKAEYDVLVNPAKEADTDTDSESEKFTSGDYEYEITEDGTAAITKYLGSDKDVTVPSELDGKKVTWIRLETFKDNKTLETVTIPDTVITVGHQVFMGCENLKEVKFPDSLKILGSGVFRDCSSIEEVTVPDSVEEMGIGIFQGCSSLKKVTLPRYGVSPFMYAGCTSLEYAPISCDDLPEGVTAVIPHKVFEGCTSLTEATIPQQVTKIYEGAFKDCTNLEKVIFPGNTEIIDGTEEGDYPVFDNCPKLTIYGHDGSNAEKYAKEHDIPFVSLDSDTTQADSDKTESPDIATSDTDTTTDSASDTDTTTDTASDTESDTSDTEIDTNIPQIDLEVTEGSEGSVFDPESNDKGVTFTINSTADKLVNVKLGDETIDPESYTVTQTDDGVSITFKPEFLEKLTSGEYSVIAHFTNGIAHMPITVGAKIDTRICGDFDGDEDVTASDALVVLRISAGLEEIDDADFALADVDGDKDITANDALSILRYSAGLDESEIIGQRVSVSGSAMVD